MTGNAVNFEFDSLTDCFYINTVFLESKLVSLVHILLSLFFSLFFLKNDGLSEVNTHSFLKVRMVE